MERFTLEERPQIPKFHYEKSRFVKNMFRAIRLTYGQQNRPTEHTIRNTITIFEAQHSLLYNIRPNKPCPVRREENIAAIVQLYVDILK